MRALRGETLSPSERGFPFQTPELAQSPGSSPHRGQRQPLPATCARHVWLPVLQPLFQAPSPALRGSGYSWPFLNGTSSPLTFAKGEYSPGEGKTPPPPF
ncbi:hypothetical protein D623_10007477 [Myotis brandtii]|uniref:Uncharacterized protein n=1 Tax=Myotis brandtii TaxID=109478 RepID=S7QA64_MYOBR|nr:hypothetical protein D623_10007477 [Myotis brandtii]